jgi:hypothetical protein
VLEDYVERVRRDPALSPDVRAMTAAEIEDHGITFLSDLAQSLVAIEAPGGPASDIVRDGTEIQRFVSELHGRQRERLGWTEAQLARDYAHYADALEAAARRRTGAPPGETETAGARAAAARGRGRRGRPPAFRHARQGDAGAPG